MTATALYSNSWHRVSALRPRLRSHIHIQRHTYRGQVRDGTRATANSTATRPRPTC